MNMIMNEKYLTELLKDEFGCIMEIGAGEGYNTKLFCQLSSSKMVIVVDPFEKSWDDEDIHPSYIIPYPLEKWKSNVSEYQDKIILVQKRSDDKTLFDELEKIGDIIFCFVDGLQREENIINDLSLVDRLKVKYVCLDDWSRETDVSQVKSGTLKFLENNTNYEILEIRENNLGTGQNRDLCFLGRKFNENQNTI